MTDKKVCCRLVSFLDPGSNFEVYSMLGYHGDAKSCFQGNLYTSHTYHAQVDQYVTLIIGNDRVASLSPALIPLLWTIACRESTESGSGNKTEVEINFSGVEPIDGWQGLSQVKKREARLLFIST